MAHKDQDQQEKKPKKIRFQTPKIIRIVILATISFIIIIIIVVVLSSWLGAPVKKISMTSNESPMPTAPIEEFFLKVGEVVQTVEAGPGTHHRIQSDKKFIAVAIQQDGSERKYEMPSGTSYWNGAAPWGRLLLKGVEDGTRVKIALIN